MPLEPSRERTFGIVDVPPLQRKASEPVRERTFGLAKVSQSTPDNAARPPLEVMSTLRRYLDARSTVRVLMVMPCRNAALVAASLTSSPCSGKP